MCPLSLVQAGGKLTVSFSEAPPLANAFDSLAEFSSKGPTKDGRVKPDLLAPGTLQSAYTDGSNTCSLRCAIHFHPRFCRKVDICHVLK